MNEPRAKAATFPEYLLAIVGGSMALCVGIGLVQRVNEAWEEVRDRPRSEGPEVTMEAEVLICQEAITGFKEAVRQADPTSQMLIGAMGGTAHPRRAQILVRETWTALPRSDQAEMLDSLWLRWAAFCAPGNPNNAAIDVWGPGGRLLAASPPAGGRAQIVAQPGTDEPR